MTPTDLQRIIERMEAHEQADTHRFGAVNSTLTEISTTLAGIGAEGTPLAIRLDRLEQRQKDRSKLLWAVLTVALALLGERMVAHMKAPDSVPSATRGGP